MTIWSADNHVRHPWFDSRLKKRIHSPLHTPPSHSALVSSDESETEALRPIKRRRCNELEQGFAHLSLKHHNADNVREQGPPTMCAGVVRDEDFDESYAMDADDGIGDRGSVLLPSSIEEPESGVPEILMTTSSWYEPEPDRIVITDLDSFETEDEENQHNSVTINPRLLEHIRKQQPPFLAETPGLTPSTATASQALVLFRPLPTLMTESREPDLVKEDQERTDVEALRDTMEMDLDS